MKKIVAAIALDGEILPNSDYFQDYPFPRLLDFREKELVLRNDYKMKTKDYRDLLVTIPYSDITGASLKVVRRMKGQRITLFNTYYDFDLHLCIKEQDEWDIETEAIYQITEGLKRIGNVHDIAGIFDHFQSMEEFYDADDQELKTIQNVRIHRESNKNDFQKFCDEHYAEWMKTYGFENGRMTYPDRKIE